MVVAAPHVVGLADADDEEFLFHVINYCDHKNKQFLIKNLIFAM